MTLSDLEKQLYTNGTFNLDMLEDTINEVKINSFKYLYSTQLQLIGYKRIDLLMSDLLLMNPYKDRVTYPKKYIRTIDFDFVSNQNKKRYKNSKFYNKEIGVFDTVSNSDIFSYTFLVFIEGKFFDSATITVKDDVTYIIFNIDTVITQTYFNTLVSANSKVTILFLPNCAYNVYNTDNTVLQKYKNNLTLPELSLGTHIDTSTNYINYINTLNLKFSAIIANVVKSTGILKFYSSAQNTFDNRYVHLNVFGIPHLLKKIDITGATKYFDIPIQNMPIPVENILIFKTINEIKYFAHDITLRLYYPNIYEVIGNTADNDLTFFVLYSDDTPNVVTLSYQNELALYYNASTNILDKYKDSTIPDIIKNFSPIEFVYDIKDFTDTASDPLRYKLDKFQAWCNQNSEILKSYLFKQLTNGTGSYLDVSTMDLASKYRLDNRQEISVVSEQEDFLEPRYLFILGNGYSNDLTDLKFFIDGLLYTPDKFNVDNDYNYYYIPVTLITQNSIIELEKPESFSFNTNLSFASIEDVIDITILKSDMEVMINDIFIINNSNGGVYVDPTSLIISIETNGELIDLDKTSSFNLTDFKLRIADTNLLGQDLTLYINKIAFTHEFEITNVDNIFNVSTFSSNEIVNNDPRNFRLFRNGQLMMTELFNVAFPKYAGDDYRVTTNIVVQIGDKYIVEYTPTKYRQIFYQEIIPQNGFVDMKGFITKPFDLKWYDAYLNGYRLNKNNIDILSPTKIFVKNVITLKNFTVFERVIEDELLPMGPNPVSVSDTLWDNIPTIGTSMTAIRPVINDILDDMITDLIDKRGPQLYDFYLLIMNSNMFINPDITGVFSQDIINEYPFIFSPDKVLLMNPDDGVGSNIIMNIFPTITTL